ncbi:opioid-binding protein/cell adhesion molecule-like [Penaeus vannamei]|uniref:opioid-binding protein/cell adhesion molecule-like n=1 Tax=Penaeus vannamei TaxID=6689 RepID=UPI00387F3E2F
MWWWWWWWASGRRERDWRCVVWACLSLLAGVTLPKGSGGLLAHASAAEEEDWGTLVAVTAERGSTARLPCKINSQNPEDPVLLVLWYKNASVTPVYSYDSRGTDGGEGASVRHRQWGDEAVWGKEQRAWFDISTTPAQLLIRNVLGRDEGNYRCKVHFKGSPSWSQRITLNVKDPPGFPKIQDASGLRLEGPIGPYEDGSTVRMICMSSGEPPPGLVWGGLGSALGGGSAVEREGNLAKTWLNVVASRSTADSVITCSTMNASVSSGIMNTVSVTLRVNLPPLRVTLESPGEWVSGGQQTSFICRVSGASPEPVIQWWLAGRQLTSHLPTVTTLAGNVSESKLKLTPEPGDHGVPLVCKAFSPNLPGTVMHQQITLAVHSSSRQHTTFPNMAMQSS